MLFDLKVASFFSSYNINCVSNSLLEMKLNGCMQVGDESYELFSAEKEGILASLARRAKVG